MLLPFLLGKAPLSLPVLTGKSVKHECLGGRAWVCSDDELPFLALASPPSCTDRQAGTSPTALPTQTRGMMMALRASSLSLSGLPFRHGNKENIGQREGENSAFLSPCLAFWGCRARVHPWFVSGWFNFYFF